MMSYKATNEPGFSYEAGTPQRKELEGKLAEYDQKVFDVPIVIGDEEIRTDNVHNQVRVGENSNFYHGVKSVY